MTMFENNNFFTPWAPPAPQRPTPGAWPRGQNENPIWYVLYLSFVWKHTQFGIKIFEIDFVIEIKWYLTFWPLWKGPRWRGRKKFAIVSPIHVCNSNTKFGWISSNSLGGESITDGRRRLQYPLSFFKKALAIIRVTQRNRIVAFKGIKAILRSFKTRTTASWAFGSSWT